MPTFPKSKQSPAKLRPLPDSYRLILMLEREDSIGILGGGHFVYLNQNGRLPYFFKPSDHQALETIRNRIDQFGVAEPEITLQGTDRILIQLPGIKDPQRAKSLIGRTALLEFKLVDEEGDIETALKGSIPEGDIILYQRVVDPKTGGVKKVPYLLKEKTLMTGEILKDARVALDTQFGEPYIALEFDDIGAKLFEQITGANIMRTETIRR